MTSRIDQQHRIALFVLVMFVAGIVYAYMQINIVPVLLIGIPGIFAYLLWYTTYLRAPTEPAIILPPFLATVAGFNFHLIEEYLGHYSLTISRLFNFAWTERSFFVTVCCLTGGLALVTIGLYYQKAVAGFVATVFVATRLSELSLFIFPFIRPHLQPQTASPISQTVSGTFLAEMPTYYFYVTGQYYFPGMYTVVFALVPALWTLYRMWAFRDVSRKRIY